MKKFFLVFVLILSVCSGSVVSGQKLIPNSSVSGVCYAGKDISRIYVPPPADFLRKSGGKGHGTITIYYTGFTAQAKTAVEYAKTILESLLPADAKVTLQASFEKISIAGVLGNTVITGYAAGWGIDALNPRAFYPVALAEKISGESLNPDLQGDMVLRINNTIPWYFGTDGNTPVNKYDLVTVVLHEICHGLGFFDSMNTEGTLGFYGSGSIPMIYDTFLEDASGKKLTDTLQIPNSSIILGSLLTGGQIFFKGIIQKTRVKLYAPSAWDSGSSISHLDESSTLKEQALMTPFINLGEAIHNPGPITASILNDLGWINTRIVHEPPGDTESNITQIQLKTEIKSDTSYNRSSVAVVYSFDNFNSSDTSYMTSPGSDDKYTSTINIPSYNSTLLYYFYVEDYFKRIYRSPSLNDVLKYKMRIGKDTTKPVITHTPLKYYLESVDSIKFSAVATDNIGVDSVIVEYKVNNGTSLFFGLNSLTNDAFSRSLYAKNLNLNGGDSIRYRIIATDKAAVPNSSVLPESGYFSVGIEDIGNVIESYSTNFSNGSADFFNIGFSIQKPAGFTAYGLHTKHPYESPGDNDKIIEYTAMLRHPFKFKESGLMFNYNEIVLVEPGEVGSTYGSDAFYDYVIIDGSKDLGKTWFDLVSGYDSHYSSSWETAYNSLIAGQNSLFEGKETMLKKHTVFIAPSAKISAGDTLLVRFRLYSDPFANGWGWAIEDLKINPLIDAIEQKSIDDKVKIYPNPGNGIIKISSYLSNSGSGKPLRYSVFNSSGYSIVNDYLPDGQESVINITEFSSGMYFILLYFDDGIKTFKYNLIK